MRIAQVFRYWLWGLSLIVSPIGAAQESHLPDYDKRPGVTGKVTSVGSDTLANLMGLWAQEFQSIYPQVKFQVQAEGSSTALPALIEGAATIGPMSRELKNSELQSFIRQYGYAPTVFKVAMDAIAIFVEHRNPLAGLTIQQVDSLFSATRFCGGEQSIERWSQLGITKDLGHDSIQLYGRNSVSGTYGLFKLMALCDGDFKRVVNEQPGSASVVLSVASSRGAMGYAAYGHKIAGVRALPIGDSAQGMIPLTAETVRSERYPFARYLHIVVNKPPAKPLPVLEREFLLFILSKSGQSLAQRDGYFTIPHEVLLRQRRIVQQ